MRIYQLRMRMCPGVFIDEKVENTGKPKIVLYY